VSLPRPGAAARAPRERVVGVYPEWDAQMGGYRRDWCTVLDAGPAEHTAEFPAACEDGFLARRLERLGLGLEQQRRRAQGDEIDLDAAVEMSVELAAGSVPDENVYRESVRRRRDLGVLVLLDVSGSSAEPSPLGARVHDHQRNAAAALLEALHRLGDRVACYAFFSRGRADVRVVRAKSFDEPFGGLVLQRLGGLRPQGFTRLGTAIRHGTALLERDSGVARRILVVLSDGQPYDFHRYEGAYGEADSRRALTEARLRGVGCLCLTIGGAGDPVSLRRVFGTAAHANARDLFEIRDQIGVLFRHALRLAERAARAPSRSSSHASEARP
jgi:nitric oxide reductase activation protein